MFLQKACKFMLYVFFLVIPWRLKIQTLGNYPEENIQHSQHGESLKSCKFILHYSEQTTAWTIDEWCLESTQLQENLFCEFEYFCNRIADSLVQFWQVSLCQGAIGSRHLERNGLQGSAGLGRIAATFYQNNYSNDVNGLWYQAVPKKMQEFN
jgi:hypothetical protein